MSSSIVNALPRDRLLVEVSLWSADLTRLADEVARMEPWADLYHFDVSDAHFVPGLLFFPALVAALRPLSRKPFHVHLMTADPRGLIDEFVDAGADIVSVHAENGPLVPAALERIGARGRGRGLVLGPDVPVEVVAPHLEVLDIVTLMGTPMGVKGRGLVPQGEARMRALAALVKACGAAGRVRLGADGGIREGTVPLLRRAGADLVVMGSLAFGSADTAATFRWARSLARDAEDLP